MNFTTTRSFLQPQWMTVHAQMGTDVNFTMATIFFLSSCHDTKSLLVIFFIPTDHTKKKFEKFHQASIQVCVTLQKFSQCHMLTMVIYAHQTIIISPQHH